MLSWLQKKVPISNQTYYHVAHTEDSVHDITLKIRNQIKVMTTTNINDTLGFIFVKLRGWRLKAIFYKQWPLNDNENNFDEMLNDENYKNKRNKLYDAGS